MIKMNMPDGIQNRDARFKILVQGPGLLNYKIPPSRSRIHGFILHDCCILLATAMSKLLFVVISGKMKCLLHMSHFFFLSCR